MSTASPWRGKAKGYFNHDLFWRLLLLPCAAAVSHHTASVEHENVMPVDIASQFSYTIRLSCSRLLAHLRVHPHAWMCGAHGGAQGGADAPVAGVNEREATVGPDLPRAEVSKSAPTSLEINNPFIGSPRSVSRAPARKFTSPTVPLPPQLTRGTAQRGPVLAPGGGELTSVRCVKASVNVKVQYIYTMHVDGRGEKRNPRR